MIALSWLARTKQKRKAWIGLECYSIYSLLKLSGPASSLASIVLPSSPPEHLLIGVLGL